LVGGKPIVHHEQPIATAAQKQARHDAPKHTDLGTPCAFSYAPKHRSRAPLGTTHFGVCLFQSPHSQGRGLPWLIITRAPFGLRPSPRSFGPTARLQSTFQDTNCPGKTPCQRSTARPHTDSRKP